MIEEARAERALVCLGEAQVCKTKGKKGSSQEGLYAEFGSLFLSRIGFEKSENKWISSILAFKGITSISVIPPPGITVLVYS